MKENLKALIHKESVSVKSELAKQGNFLGDLLHDKEWIVRSYVAEYGYGLETLLHDEHWMVRWEVALHGFGLNILTYDENWMIRKEVAKHGVNLSLLVNDEIEEVSCLAKKMLSCKSNHFIRMTKEDSNDNVYFRIFEDYYEIECFHKVFDSIEDWEEYSISEVGLLKTEEVFNKIKGFIRKRVDYFS